MKRLSRNPPEVATVQLESNLDARYWMQRLSVSRIALESAVQAVGKDADEVTRFIDRARGRRCARAHEAESREISSGLAATPPPDRSQDAIHRIQYVSRAVPDVSDSAISAIVDWSSAFNATVGVSGALTFTGSHFTQVLEGAKADVLALFDSIRRDVRHRDLRLISAGRSPVRHFARWTMVVVAAAGIQDLVEELWWAHRLDSARAAQLAQHLLHLLERSSGSSATHEEPAAATQS